MRIKLRESDKLGMHKEQKQATVSKVRVVGTEMRLKASPRVATEPTENVWIFHSQGAPRAERAGPGHWMQWVTLGRAVGSAVQPRGSSYSQ